MNQNRIEEIRARCEAATPGPWRWMFNEHCQDIMLVTDHSGMYYVMGFARYGMHNAQPLFQRYDRHEGPLGERGSRGMVKASELGKWAQDYRHNDGWIDHPDAIFIAAASADISFLLDELSARDARIEELEKERNAAIFDLASVGDCCFCSEEETQEYPAICGRCRRDTFCMNDEDHWEWRGPKED